MGYEQSRRDDLEGLVYTLIYLAKGSLFYQNIQAPQRTLHYWNAPEDINSKVERKVNRREKEILEENVINKFEGKTKEESKCEVADENNQKYDFETLDISEQGESLF